MTLHTIRLLIAQRPAGDQHPVTGAIAVLTICATIMLFCIAFGGNAHVG